MRIDGDWRGRLQQLVLPAVIAFWLLGKFAFKSGETAWIALSRWASHIGVGSLEVSSEYVTTLVTCLALAGAALRIAGASRRKSSLRWWGLIATSLPPALLLPESGAIFFGVGVLVLAGCTRGVVGKSTMSVSPDFVRWWHVCLRECFPLLSAICFAALSWEYNAELLTRSLLIASGTALLARAMLPRESEPPSALDSAR